MTPVRTNALISESLADTAILRWPHLSDIPQFAHAITTRPWNMAAHRGPDTDQTVSRRRRICEHLGLPFDRLTAPDQIHSPHVLQILSHDIGAGRDGPRTAIKFVDGLVCDLVDVPVIQFSADCPLILVIEPHRRVFGLAHASWRGTVTNITTELIRQMRSCFSVDPKSLLVGIAPCAGPNEYEVGDDVRRIALARQNNGEKYFARRGDRWTFDMRAANVAQLLEAGVDPGHIIVAAESTMADPRFYSHRRDGGETGRFAVIAGFRAS